MLDSDLGNIALAVAGVAFTAAASWALHDPPSRTKRATLVGLTCAVALAVYAEARWPRA